MRNWGNTRALAWASTGVALTLVAVGVGLAAEQAAKEVTLNVKSDGAKKFEANQSQIGYTKTRVFYTLADQKAVVVISIDNKSKSDFPVSGVVHLFAADVTPEGLAKWLNNQHSDGLYPDVPNPTATIMLSADASKLSSSKAAGRQDAGLGTYDKFAVTFTVGDTSVRPGLRLKGFSDSANVFVPVK